MRVRVAPPQIASSCSSNPRSPDPDLVASSGCHPPSPPHSLRHLPSSPAPHRLAGPPADQNHCVRDFRCGFGARLCHKATAQPLSAPSRTACPHAAPHAGLYEGFCSQNKDYGNRQEYDWTQHTRAVANS
eukprot:1019835-Rhodomonas_salina.1